MSALRSSVLIIGHPDPQRVEFGSDFAHNFLEVQALLREGQYQVLIFSVEQANEDNVLLFLKHLTRVRPQLQKIAVKGDATPERLKIVVNTASIFRFLDSYEDVRFDRSVQEALEEANLIGQNQELLQTVKQQNQVLKKLSLDLEERVEKRQKSLKDASRKLETAQHRYATLHRALIAIHEARSLGEMEILLCECLANSFAISWIRILFQSPAHIRSRIAKDIQEALWRVPLYKGREMMGEIIFAKDTEKPFTKEETLFLNQVAEVVALALDRTSKIDQGESLKQQWEATFDAISSPVSLINSNYTILRTNRAYAERSALPSEQILGRKCYEVLFKRTEPCDNCQLGKRFRIKDYNPQAALGNLIEVSSQNISMRQVDQPLYIQIYHDISEQVRLERQIVESAKMAELGTIGSSIAHELNNPLGGMINFLQLMKLELTGDESYANDITDMELGAQRCKDIVQNLLGFSRRSDLNDFNPITLLEPLHQALKITELQSRAQGIKVTITHDNENYRVMGRFNLLAQAFLNIIQILKAQVAQKMRKQIGFLGEVTIDIKLREKDIIEIYCSSNAGLLSPADDKEKYDLSWAVTRKILEESGGHTSSPTPAKPDWNCLIELPIV